MSRPAQKIVAFLLRELLSAGALSGVVSSLLDGGVGGAVRVKALDAVRDVVRENLWRIVLATVAVMLLLTSTGFLIAAFFLWLLTQFGPPLAAAMTGGLLLVAGGVLFWVSGMEARADKPAEKPAAPSSGTQPLFEMASTIFRDLKEGASKHSALIIALLFLAGLWLGFNEDDDDDNDKTPRV